MTRDEVVAEVWAALRTDVTHVGNSCFVTNRAMTRLARHGAARPAAVESVVNDAGFGPAVQTEPLVERNLLHLFLVYFERGDDCGWDAVPFVRSLRGVPLHAALVAVFHVWGPARGTGRRRAMPRALYEAWHALPDHDPDWRVVTAANLPQSPAPKRFAASHNLYGFYEMGRISPHSVHDSVHQRRTLSGRVAKPGSCAVGRRCPPRCGEQASARVRSSLNTS